MAQALYATPNLFNKALAERFEEFDFNGSENLPRWYFKDTSGTEFIGTHSRELFLNLNRRFGDFLDIEGCIARNRMYIITYLDESQLSKPEKEVIEEIVEVPEDSSPEENPVILENPTTVEFLQSSVAVPFKSDEPVFDLEYAKSLYNSKEKSASKDELEIYGLQFGIDLKKNMTFNNMLIALEEFLSKK